MTKRHFEAIANAIRTSEAFPSNGSRTVFAGDLAVALKAINERFDVEHFAAACLPANEEELHEVERTARARRKRAAEELRGSRARRPRAG